MERSSRRVAAGGGGNRAVEHVLRAPASDPAALAFKVALAVDEQVWELPGGEESMARLKADASRLCGPPSSPT